MQDTQITHLTTDVQALRGEVQRGMDQLGRQLSDDRRATDQRLRWLETHVWTSQHGQKGS